MALSVETQMQHRALVRQHRELSSQREQAQREVARARTALLEAAVDAVAQHPALAGPAAAYIAALRRLEDVTRQWQSGRFKS